MSTLNNPTNKIMQDVYSLENKRVEGKALAIEQSDEYSYGGTVFVHTSASSHELDPVLFKEIALFDENSFTGPAQNMIWCIAGLKMRLPNSEGLSVKMGLFILNRPVKTVIWLLL